MNHTRTIQKISLSKSCFNSTEIQTCVAGYAHSIGYIHYQVKIGSSWLQHARGEEAERGDKPLYCYTLTRKNLEVKHHRETDSKHD